MIADRAKSGPGSLPFYLWIGAPKVAVITNVPTVARQINDVPLHDAFWIAHAGVVSERLRDVIEGIEPNTHQFFPLKLHRKNGSLISDNYFIMHVAQRVPCVFFKKSKETSLRRVRFGDSAGSPIFWCSDDGLVISKPAFGSRHLFSTSIVAGGLILVSDTLGDELKRQNIRDLYMSKITEIEDEWLPEEDVPEFMEWLEDHPDEATSLEKL